MKDYATLKAGDTIYVSERLVKEFPDLKLSLGRPCTIKSVQKGASTSGYVITITEGELIGMKYGWCASWWDFKEPDYAKFLKCLGD